MSVFWDDELFYTSSSPWLTNIGVNGIWWRRTIRSETGDGGTFVLVQEEPESRFDPGIIRPRRAYIVMGISIEHDNAYIPGTYEYRALLEVRHKPLLEDGVTVAASQFAIRNWYDDADGVNNFYALENGQSLTTALRELGWITPSLPTTTRFGIRFEKGNHDDGEVSINSWGYYSNEVADWHLPTRDQMGC